MASTLLSPSPGSRRVTAWRRTVAAFPARLVAPARRPLQALALPLALAVPALQSPPLAGRATATPGVQKIAFYSERWGLGEICLMAPDGSDLLRLTHDSFDDSSPAISSDGSRIAYLSKRSGNYDLFAMHADGTGAVRLTTTTANEFDPEWSPDGTRIVFTRRTGYNADGDVYVMNADGSGVLRLTATAADEMRPDWSPDGSRIVFSSTRDGRWEIYTMNPDGSGVQRVTNAPGEKVFTQWSPDGTRIAYVLYDFTRWRANVHVMDADGSDDVALTSLTGINEDPVWSPDGTRIAFQSDRDGNYEIYSMDVTGADVRRLTSSSAGDYWPSWAVVTVPAGVDGPPGGGALALAAVNPARGTATVRFALPRDAQTTLRVFDSTGRVVRTLLRQRLAAGAHSVTWDGRDDAGRACAPGVYHCVVASGEARRSAKLVLVR